MIRKTRATSAAGAIASAAALAGCAGVLGAGDEPEDGGPVTLTITTFGTMGFEELYEEYERGHPGITIEATNYDQGGEARAALFEAFESGAAPPDIVALEEGWLGQVMAVDERFVDLRDYHIDSASWRWVPWKYEQGTAPSGRVIGAGTDIGPMGLCYRRDLFAQAGLPTDREDVARYFQAEGGGWDRYFDVGREYRAATGNAWYDQPLYVWNAMVNQLGQGYYDIDGRLIVGENAELAAQWDRLARAQADGLSAGEAAWDWDGGKAFTDESFATFMCPGWMLGVVKDQLRNAGGGPETGWDFADVFPGGAANWGGSFLGVPAASEHPDQAAELVLWLTKAEQQEKAFEVAGTFPSTEEMVTVYLKSRKGDPVFGGAPTAAILAGRTEGVRSQYKGPLDSQIQDDAFGEALTALDRGELTADAAWDQALAAVEELASGEGGE
ncbi:extracellular solute-binding protein [Myceligenerans pegani]|uniref:Carbohydrate ABC transporter substrate-binding protein n=1 Tax=Myceligenerans pegani TaxID=2776917 RepID=A0ABR9N1E7_9MICO|nr:ABC transporter substrate-binding protein [Myceligenerans sp. TRM 65318]MBE1876908.1 carbohydrate ABC transporter substrate-binding protein [Myceligenerans sp. TRM 65318]MBE3019179.1 carbohydrate ABC transporter substrate-binding protein [Myceligenerans sp. TRM 65318]